MVKGWVLTAVLLAITLGVIWGAADLTYRLLKDDIEPQISRAEGITSLSAISQEKLDDVIDSTGPYEDYHRIDPDLGWSISKNVDGERYSSNSIGIRGKREYPIEKPEGIEYRIAAFGDSFTHGDDVADESTWQYFMEEKNPKLEVMNFGVGGYGTDQAWLRYQLMGKPFEPDIVLIGFMVENINRNVNAFVTFYRRLSTPVTKPRFSLDSNNELVLHENTLKTKEDYIQFRDNQREYLQKLGQHDYYYQRLFLSKFDYNPVKLAYYIAVNITDPWVLDHNRQYNPRSEPFRVTLAILENFYKEAEREGSAPWIVIFPEMEDVAIARKGGLKRYKPLLDELKKRDMRVMEIVEGLKRKNQLSLGRLFNGHYTEYGNEIVADIILESLDLEP